MTVPKLALKDKPVTCASCEDIPCAVPCAEVIDKPDGNTVWLGAYAVPCEAVND